MFFEIQAVGLGYAVIGAKLDKITVIVVDVFFKLAIQLIQAEILSLRQAFYDRRILG